MKHVSLLLALLPLLYSCSGKSSDQSSSGSGSVAQNQNPAPPPPPPNRKLLLQDADFTQVEAMVTEDGTAVVIYPPSRPIEVKLQVGLASANLGFIIEDHSILKGCRSHAASVKRALDSLGGQGPIPRKMVTDRLNNEREIMRMEAGYFNAIYDTTSVATRLADVAINTAHAVGFPNVQRAFPAQMKRLEGGLDKYSLALLIETPDQYFVSYGRLLQGHGQSRRLLIGELCELVQGAESSVVYGGSQVEDRNYSMRVASYN